MNVYACTCLKDDSFGNLRQSDLEQVLNTNIANKYKYYKVKEDSVCFTCRYKNICNGGCIGMSKVFFGDIGYGDIRCPIVRSRING